VKSKKKHKVENNFLTWKVNCTEMWVMRMILNSEA
jgi:hypothetical protein